MSGDKPMKSGKLLLIMSIVSILFVGTLSSVVADDEEYILEDDQDDVLAMDITNEDYNTTDEKPNIDIKQLTYSKTDGSTDATVILEVFGTIEDRGSLDENDIDAMFNSVTYVITVETSEESYQVTYVNQICQLTYSSTYDIINITDYTKSGGTLTIHLDLMTSDETYVSLSGETLEFDYDLLSESGGIYADMAPNEEGLMVDIYGPDSGEVGEELEFEADAYDFYGTEGTYTYQWDFDDGSTSTLQNPTHSYSAEGDYEITLTVTDENDNDAEAIPHTVTISSGEPTNGGNGNGDEGSAGLLLFVAIIIIIALVGIAAVVYIIRR